MQPNPVILSEREQNVLEFVKQFRNERGFSPSLREIARHTGHNSTSLASYYLDRLEQAGLIRRGKNVARAIVLVEQ